MKQFARARLVMPLKRLNRIVRVTAGALLSASACAAAAPNAGPVIGVIDSVRYDTDRYYVVGWACQQGNRASIAVHLYAGGAAGGKPPGTFVTPGTADLPDESAVDHECHDADGGKKASDSSYGTITDQPYLYYVRMDDDHGPYQRVLFRQKIKLDWLFKQAEATAHPALPH
jgi:hypothetical protein